MKSYLCALLVAVTCYNTTLLSVDATEDAQYEATRAFEGFKKKSDAYRECMAEFFLDMQSMAGASGLKEKGKNKKAVVADKLMQCISTKLGDGWEGNEVATMLVALIKLD